MHAIIKLPVAMQHAIVQVISALPGGLRATENADRDLNFNE